MFPVLLRSSLLALMTIISAPLHAQAPGVELDGYYARSNPRSAERPALPARACISTTCMLPLPGRNNADGPARRETRDEIDAPSRYVNVPENPRWEARR